MTKNIVPSCEPLVGIERNQMYKTGSVEKATYFFDQLTLIFRCKRYFNFELSLQFGECHDEDFLIIMKTS